jgi:hypothetical protein
LPPACSLVCWTYFFDPEDGGDMFLRNVGWNSTDYRASYPRNDTLHSICPPNKFIYYFKVVKLLLKHSVHLYVNWMNIKAN